MDGTAEIEQKKNSRRGLIGTLSFHAAILLLLFLIRLLAPVPPPEEGGILINFGTSDQGTGDVQPEQAATTDDQQESNAEKEEQPTESAAKTEPQPNKTQEVEDAPKVAKEKPKPVVQKPKPKPVEKPKEPEKPKVDTRALYPGKQSKPGQGSSGSEGETGQPGDQGDPDGDKNAKSHTGGGKGNSGVSYSLGGRNMRVRPPIDDQSQETGKVVVNISVDKYGNVTNATAPGRGSTTSDYNLVRKSREAAMKAKFSPCNKTDCEVAQVGTITFVFLVN